MEQIAITDIPGIKIGLANIVTVFAIVRLSIIDAAAIGAIRVIVILTLSPGITISTPCSSSIEPVTSVVLK